MYEFGWARSPAVHLLVNLSSPLYVMTVAVIRSARSDVTSAGGDGTTGVENLQEC